jgi:hypothetical protein
MANEEHVSPDGALTLVVSRDGDGDITLGFAGFTWHTHGDLLVEGYGFADATRLTPESATQRFVEDVVANRAIIVVQRIGQEVRDVWVTADPEGELRHKQLMESLQFRHWDGSDARPSTG